MKPARKSPIVSLEKLDIKECCRRFGMVLYLDFIGKMGILLYYEIHFCFINMGQKGGICLEIFFGCGVIIKLSNQKRTVGI